MSFLFVLAVSGIECTALLARKFAKFEADMGATKAVENFIYCNDCCSIISCGAYTYNYVTNICTVYENVYSGMLEQDVSHIMILNPSKCNRLST